MKLSQAINRYRKSGRKDIYCYICKICKNPGYSIGKSPQIFCTPKCQAASKKTARFYNCSTCGKLTLRQNCFIKRKKTKNVFCGITCARKYFSGKNSPTWKGGISFNGEGYRMIRVNDKYRPEHRLIMEKHIGRSLLKNELVHHIDHNRLNNSITNLQIMTIGEHTKHHSPWNNRTIKP